MVLAGAASALYETHKGQHMCSLSLALLSAFIRWCQAPDAEVRGGFVAVHCTSGAQHSYFLIPGIWAIRISAVCSKHAVTNICGVTRVTLCLFMGYRIQSHQICHADF